MPASTANQLLKILGPNCRDTRRRGLLLGQTALNGIDFVEFEERPGPPIEYVLHVHFLNDLPVDPFPLPADVASLLVHGGTRVVGIRVTGATKNVVDPTRVLDVAVDAQGDFSPYLLSFGWSRDNDGDWVFSSKTVDRFFSVAPVNFRPGCPIDFDCAPVDDCPPDVLPEPMLDYLAKDYASFRQMLLDLVAQRNPNWTARSPADIGLALLELFAYEGDQLSYFQDAIANEAFLDTARQRVSAKRHARLVDYQMHDGRNAWTFVHFNVITAGTIAPGYQLLTRITEPMRFDRQAGGTIHPTSPPKTVLNFVTDEDYRADPALAQVRVFETAATATVHPLNNDLRLHSWGNESCCLPRGATTAHLYAVETTAGVQKATRPPLKPGDYLLFEEVLGPESGAPADADPAHRVVVRIESVTPDPSTTFLTPTDSMQDHLFLDQIDPVTGVAKPATAATMSDPKLPLVEVTWRKVDALTFPLCLSAKLSEVEIFPRVSVARGNIALADHGRSVAEEPATFERFDFDRPLDGSPGFRLRLNQGPLTMQCQPDGPVTTFPPLIERPNLTCDVRRARPAVAVRTRHAATTETDDWWPVPDLLSSQEFDAHFVADVDAEGRAVLRFGDGEYGERLSGVDRIEVWYRVGNGRTGNIGAESLAHIVTPPDLSDWPEIDTIRNPLAAHGGIDPELIDQVRHYAPAAFRARQLRAVTEQDYKDAALTIDGVAGAVANFRWTGSWYTVFVGIDPADPDQVLTGRGGVTQLAPVFRQHVHDGLSRFRLAGYDLEIRSARYVPLDIAIELCAKPGYFRGDVARAVSLALGAGKDRGDTLGFFNPANLTFGQPVYLSRIYATIEKVEGVESARVTLFHRHARAPEGELENGRIAIGSWEIARLDNNPSNMENGTLTITAGGGS